MSDAAPTSAPGEPAAPPAPPPPFAYPPWWAFPPLVAFRPGPPTTRKPYVAGVLWCLVMLRDMGFLVVVSIMTLESGGRQFPPDTFISPVHDPFILIALVAAGLAATGVALFCAFSRTHYLLGLAAGTASVVLSITPGVFIGFGLVGVVLGAVGLGFHVVSRAEFAAPPPPFAAGAPAWP